MPPAPPDTRAALLRIATDLVERGGYNAFSFRDLAGRAGITTASVHYHFPTKGDLGLALVADQRAQEAAFRARLDAEEPDAWRRLAGFWAGYRRQVADGRRMCLCGMLAAEYASLPGPVVEAVRGFFTDNEAWIAALLREGRRAGVLTYAPPAAGAARAVYAAVEGAMLAARAFGDLTRFDAVAAWHLARLKA